MAANRAWPMPALPTVTCRNRSAGPLSNQLVIGRATTRSVAASYVRTSTDDLVRTRVPISSVVPSAKVTRVVEDMHPNITPIFSRSWLMKIAVVPVLLSAPVILRSAWLINRACRPTWLSPISPSISARGTRAATESITMMSSAPERISMSAISSACSPVSGWLTSSASVSTPSFFA